MYSEDAVKNASGKIVVFFHADWCGTCKRIQKDIFANTIPDGVTILQADYDNDLELKKKYGVNKTSTLVQIDNTGKKIQSFFVSTLDEIVQKVSK
jgi:thiol-disulfide isomerase/thioredoxin